MQQTEFGKWLKHAMAQRGLKLRQTAALAHVSPSTVHNALHGVYRPSSKTCKLLAEFFHVDADYLLELADHRFPTPILRGIERLAPELRYELEDVEGFARLTLRDQRLVAETLRMHKKAG